MRRRAGPSGRPGGRRRHQHCERRAIVSSKQKDQVLGNDSKGAEDKRAGAHRSAKPPKGVDRWFDAELNKLYVEVVNEPLPADLERLVSQLKARKAT